MTVFSLSSLRLVGLCLLLCASAGLAQTATASSTTPSSTAVALPDLGIRLDLPAELAVHSEDAKKAETKFTHRSPSGKPCVTIPLIAYASQGVSGVLLWHYNGDCLDQPVGRDKLRSMALKVLQSTLHAQGKEHLSSPLDYEMGTLPAAVLTGTVYSRESKGILFSELSCNRIHKDVLCWQFTENTISRARRLAALTVHIDQLPPMPVVPEEESKLALLPTNTFHDDSKHVEFLYPGTYADAQQLADDTLTQQSATLRGKAKALVACTKIKLAAYAFEEDERSNLSIIDFDLSCNGSHNDEKHTEQIAKGLVKGISKGSKLKTSRTIPFSAQGVAFLALGGRLTSKDHTLHTLDVCANLAGDTYCWQMVSTSAEDLHTLAQGSLVLGSGLGTPLVPQDVYEKISR
ncbi:MAG: hypothetical protein PW735_01050 [Acidobacteriaceae bacterium]|nr:hypothetical protein [Acidobacteriaceae bacterium]